MSASVSQSDGPPAGLDADQARHAYVPGFSIVMPTYNRCDVVDRTIRQLLAVDYPADRFEIIVVDNSTDGTPAMVARHHAETAGRVRLLSLPERLPAIKRNRGQDEASHEYVLFINDDVWVEPQFLAEHARSHLSHPEPVAVLGYVRQSAEMEQTPFIRHYQPFAYHELADRADAKVGWLHFWSMNLSMPRSTIQERNLRFHEDWAEIGNEDVELGYRWVNRAGLPAVYNPLASGEHFHPHTVASAGAVQRSIGRGLRDLTHLIPERTLLDRYGVLSLRSSPRGLARGVVRELLFNRYTVPPLTRWLDGLPAESDQRIARWMYWKVLMHHVNAGYRSAPGRTPSPLPVHPPRHPDSDPIASTTIGAGRAGT